jgi:hypothetical protein
MGNTRRSKFARPARSGGGLSVRASERSKIALRSPEALLSAASGVHASSACSAARKRWYKLAMRDLNSTKATVLVREAETPMFKRYVEIADSPDACGERVQIENALDDLSALKHLKDTPNHLLSTYPSFDPNQQHLFTTTAWLDMAILNFDATRVKPSSGNRQRCWLLETELEQRLARYR